MSGRSLTLRCCQRSSAGSPPPHRGPHRPAQVRGPPRARGLGAPGAPLGRGEPHPGHDPAHRRQFLRGAGVERLAPERFGGRGHQAECGLLLVTVPGQAGGRHVENGPVHLRRDLRVDREHGLDRTRVREEVGAEHLIVDVNVVLAADQRRAAGPVQVEEVGRVQRGHRRAVGQQVARADGQPGRPERGHEARQDADERRLVGPRASGLVGPGTTGPVGPGTTGPVRHRT